MLIEYYASDLEDTKLEHALSAYFIKEWFNPEDGYYVIETDDDRVITTMSLMGIELYISSDSADSDK